MKAAGFVSFSRKKGQGMRLLQRLLTEDAILELPGVFEVDSNEAERSRTEASTESSNYPAVKTFSFQLLVSWAESGLLPLAVQLLLIQKNPKRAGIVSACNLSSPGNLNLCSIRNR